MKMGLPLAVQFEAPQQNGTSCMNNTTRDILCRATKECDQFLLAQRRYKNMEYSCGALFA